MRIEKISLFDMKPEPSNTVMVKKEKKTEQKKEYSFPDLSGAETTEDILRRLYGRKFVPYVKRGRVNTFMVTGNKFIASQYYSDSALFSFENGIPAGHSVKKEFIYFQNDLTAWSLPITFKSDKGLYIYCIRDTTETSIVTATVGKWRPFKKMPTSEDCLVNPEIIPALLKANAPYLYEWVNQYSGVDEWQYAYAVCCPQLEQLSKAGYVFADTFMGEARRRYSKTAAEAFNRLCKPGTKIKDIFKTDKAVYKTLINETDLRKWDSFRKIIKRGSINKESVREIYEANFAPDELESLATLLNRTYNGKPVFTWKSLLAYLQRIDQFQAIGHKEGLMLLNDYLRMCDVLEIKPHIDSDSLKREHDVAARNCRNLRNEQMVQGVKNAAERLAANDYEEDIFFIRGIRDYDDLMNEAKQQHNCVASYASAIASGRSSIYVMREKKHPETSLITVEIGSDGNIRQKYRAYNQPIHNRAQSEFLERWQKRVKARIASRAK